MQDSWAAAMSPTFRPASLLLLAPLLLLTACDPLGLDDQANAAAAREAEGRAIGSGCRQSGRALEDCYTRNAKASKAAIFAGWRDMDGYMRENKLEIVPPASDLAKPAEAHPAEPGKAPPGEEKIDGEKAKTPAKTTKS